METQTNKEFFDALNGALSDVFNNGMRADKAIGLQLKAHPRLAGYLQGQLAQTVYAATRWWRPMRSLIRDVDKAGPSRDGDLAYKPADLDGLMAALRFLTIGEQDAGAWPKGLTPKILRARWARLQENPAMAHSMPDWLEKACAAELGADWEPIARTLLDEPAVYLRVNLQKTTPAKLAGALKVLAPEPVPGSRDALVVRHKGTLFRSPEFIAGHFEVQDLSSQQVAPFLQAKPGMRVVDVCAGEGGKTLHLSALLENKGRILSLDTEEWKLENLRRRCRRAGAFNVEPRLIEGTKTAKRLASTADAVLIDAPCSGLGVLRRHPDIKWKLTEDSLPRLRELQAEILDRNCRIVKKGGALVYATCSLLPSEGEAQVRAFVARHPGLFALEAEQRISPATGPHDGFYMARLRRL